MFCTKYLWTLSCNNTFWLLLGFQNKIRQFGLDILTADEKTFYPLAAESEKDAEEWIAVLNKVVGGVENDDQGILSIIPFCREVV